MERIDYNRPYLTGREFANIEEAHKLRQLAGDGAFTKKCQAWLEQQTKSKKVLLTHSCTAALELAALLADVKPGDEVIMPSFTFVSTANAVALRGGVPVFVDIREDTLNLDETLVEAAITKKTKAISPIHYAGVSAEMDKLLELAHDYRLMLIEDAAQGLMASYKGKPLGSMGQLGTISFHETKNVHSGEGGAILINDPALVERAEILREKGTNRSQFLRGQVQKYRWLDVGSSFLPGELIAAFLLAQLEQAEAITDRRRVLWSRYHEALAPLEAEGKLRRPVIPAACDHNTHIYYILLKDEATRAELIDFLKARNIHAVFHYLPLHSAPAGRIYGRAHGNLKVTDDITSRLLRLPLWIGLEEHQQRVIDAVREFFVKQ